MRNRKTTTSLAVLCVLGWAVLSHAATVVKPTFSQPHGFYSSSFSVRISSATAGATIRYTTDGSKPTGSYGTALANGGSVSIGRTTPLRAVACKGGMTTSAPFTQTYIFPSQVRSQTRPAGYPVTCYPENGTAYTADYEMDPDIVNHASYSGELVNDLKAIPSISLVLPREKLFGTNGTPDGVWNQGGYHGGQNTLEVETSAEWIYPGRAGFQIDCGLKNHAGPGAKSCCRFLFKSNYGGPQTLDYPVFEDAPLNASSAAATFGKLFLRSGNNDSWFAFWVSDAKQRQRTYLRDEWVRQSMIEMTGFGSHGTFVHVYLNGLYWGVYNVIERPDARHATIYKGGSKSDWYAHNHGGSVSGNASRYNYLHNTLVPSGGFANASTYNTVKQYVDVERFCDYVMTGWYAGTGDWGANNFYAVVRNNPAGGLQYMNWDQDVSWDDAHGVENCGAWVNPTFLGTGGRTSDRNSPMCKLWRALDDNSDFRALFADRVYKHCFNGGALTETRAKARWDAFRNYLDPAMACESARWGDFLKDQGRGATVFTRNDHWRPGCDWVRNQMTGNVGRFVSALRASGYYPSLNPPTFSQHGGTVASGYKLTINRNNGSGTIYYRTDGDDPRVSGGGILAGSSTGAASAVVTLTATTTVKARVKNGATWSALAGATFTVTGSSVPAAPGSLTAAALSATQIRIGWTDNSGNETGFKIDRRQSGASDWVRVATPGANTTTYTDSGLPAATEFYYQVKAYNAAGDSGYSNVAGATTEDTLPAAPSELAAAALSTSQIRVSWSDNSSNETQFKIRWGTSVAAMDNEVFPSANTTSWTHSGLSADTTYYYKIRSENAAGVSAYTAVVSAQTDTALPAQPSNLAASALSTSRIQVTWTDTSNNETRFKIRRSPDGTDFDTLAPLYPAADATTITDTGLDPGTTYHYIIRSENAAGVSAYTAPVSATTPADLESFTAYNDLAWFSGQTSGNITTYTTTNGFAVGVDCGLLIDHATGQPLPVRLRVAGGSGVIESQGLPPAAGTDAYGVFAGQVDATGTISYGADDLMLTFTGMDPALRYELVVYSDRNDSRYVGGSARYHYGTLSGAASFENASTAGTTILTETTDEDTTRYNAGYNNPATAGYVTRFKNVDPGADGSIVLSVKADSANGCYSYANALMLRAAKAAAPDEKIAKGAVWRYRKGTAEASAPATAWRRPGHDGSAWASGPTPLGYGSAATGTVLGDMKNSYTSVFMRREFVVENPALVNALMWSVRYDDGFILWVNGEEAARVNVAGAKGEFVPYDGTSAANVSDTWTATMEGTDIPELVAGTNVVALHVFNRSLDSGDLVVDCSLSVVRYALPTAEDADQDGMSDEWETQYLADLSDPSDRPDADPDGDGLSNLDEYIAGTDPVQNGSWFMVDVALSNGVVVSFPTVQATGAAYAGKSRYYTLEEKTGPAGAWLVVPGYSKIPGQGQVVTYQPAGSPDDSPMFHRARVWLQAD